MRNKVIIGLVCIFLVGLVLADTNISIQYGWNGTDYIPFKTTGDGRMMTDINKANFTVNFAVATTMNVSGNLTIGEVLPFVNNLSTIKYNFKTDKEGESKKIGFIAQDFIGEFDEVLSTEIRNGTEYYGIRYTEVVPILAKGIQELSAENDALKEKLQSTSQSFTQFDQMKETLCDMGRTEWC